MTYEKLCDLWPSLTTDVQRQIVDPDQDDPEWMRELSPYYRDELRRECEKELEMMRREAERRSDNGHPEYGDDYCIGYVPDEQYGGFNRVIRSTGE